MFSALIFLRFLHEFGLKFQQKPMTLAFGNHFILYSGDLYLLLNCSINWACQMFLSNHFIIIIIIIIIIIHMFLILRRVKYYNAFTL